MLISRRPVGTGEVDSRYRLRPRWCRFAAQRCRGFDRRGNTAQLTRVGQEVIYERIPTLQHQVRQQASELALQAVAASGATTLADFYTTRLFTYFEQSRGWSYEWRPTTARRRALMREMHDIRRYLSDQEQGFCERLFALIRKKDDLDYHESRQRILKLWLFVHIGLTCTLVLLGTLHGLLALAFAGGGA
jgi:hypothetical protein